VILGEPFIVNGNTISGEGSGYDSLSQLRIEIDQFVAQFLPETGSTQKIGPKVVHDGLWGTLRLEPYEVALLDTPLVQRLRHLRQTGLSFLTYPSTTHSRFEHTLGVVLQVMKLGDALLRPALEPKKDDGRLTQDHVRQMRLAALLHDIGHGPFSHTSEMVYGDAPSLKEFKKKHPKANPHETMANLILTSEPFRKYFREAMQKGKEQNHNIEEIANTIVGDVNNENPYVTELLNGPFDADKLDYIFRDSHFSGLPLDVDLDRLWYTVRLGKTKKEGDVDDHLVVLQGGVTALEQVFFSKMVLTATVYQHHKVRACDCMFAGIIEYMREHGKTMEIRDKHLAFHSPADFLWITDDEFLSYGFRTDDDQLHELIHNLYFRRLLKRALIISCPTVNVEEEGALDNFNRLLNTHEDAHLRREISREIWEKAGRPGMKEQVFLDMPKRPKFVAADETYIYHAEPSDTATNKPITLNDLIKVDSWAKQYMEHRYRGHVFCPPEHRATVAKAAIEVLQERFDIKFKPEAYQWCKVALPS